MKQQKIVRRRREKGCHFFTYECGHEAQVTRSVFWMKEGDGPYAPDIATFNCLECSGDAWVHMCRSAYDRVERNGPEPCPTCKIKSPYSSSSSGV